MAIINPSLPVVLQPDSTEDPKIVTCLSTIIATINALDTANLANNAVTAAKIEAQQAWQTIALAGSTWSPANLSYYKDSLGIVHFRGEEFTTSGNVAATTTLCTLPAGYRPGTTQRFLATSGGGIVLFTITAAGVVSNTSLWSQGTVGAPMSFGVVHFRAEN